jgi:hypothetical protein
VSPSGFGQFQTQSIECLLNLTAVGAASTEYNRVKDVTLSVRRRDLQRSYCAAFALLHVLTAPPFGSAMRIASRFIWRLLRS